MGRLTLTALAYHILADNDCDEYTYGGPGAENVLKDLMEAYQPQDLAPYTYIEVANAILSVSRPKPIERKPFRVLYDMPEMTDAFDCDTYGIAITDLQDLYEGWMIEERNHWEDETPTPEEADKWNQMLYEFSAIVQKYNPDIDEYEDYWYPSESDLESWGWKEIPEREE